MISNLFDLLKKGGLVAIIGGIVAFVFGMLFGTLAAIPLWGTVSLLIAIVLALALASKGEIDNYNLFDFIILLAMVAVIGGVVTAFVPVAAPFILSVGAFTVGGLVWTFVYILCAEMIIGYFD